MLVAGLALQFGRLTLGAWADIRSAGPALPDQAFGLITGAAGTAVTTWLLCALAASAVAALSSRSRLGLPATRTARRIAPVAVRNAVAALLGVALVATPAVAQAASLSTSGVSRAATASAHLGAGLEPAFAQARRPLTLSPASAHPADIAALPADIAVHPADVSALPADIAVHPADVSALPADIAVHPADVSALPADIAVYPGGADIPTPAGQSKLLQVLSPGWTPERPQPTAATSRHGTAQLEVVAPGPRRPPTADDPVRHHVVVRRGDTLWSIAARHLGSGATDAEIAQEWPRWYRINRHLIGADPHRLLPGERLRSPDVITASTAPEETSR
jgi:nucleoid-associated protein YgaU